MASKEPVRVLVTGAAGQIELDYLIVGAYNLGANQLVILDLHGMESADEALNGAMKKLGNGVFPLLVDVVATNDVVEACTGVKFAVVDVGKKGTEAKDFMPFYKSLASALGLHAAAGCEIWAASDLEDANELFSESTMSVKDLATLDPNLAYAERLNVPANRVENANICGNRPSTPYPDTNFATVKTPNGEKSVHDQLPTDGARIDGEFINKVSEGSSAMSAASSACDHIRHCQIGTPEETLVSMGEDSDGSHSVPAGRNGTQSILEDLGTPTPAIFQSEFEGKIKQLEEIVEMLYNKLTELENRAGAALHDYSSRIDELDRHAARAFENVCNMIEFLNIETDNLQSNLAIAHVYLHRAVQEADMWRQLYRNLRSRVNASRVSIIPVPHAASRQNSPA